MPLSRRRPDPAIRPRLAAEAHCNEVRRSRSNCSFVDRLAVLGIAEIGADDVDTDRVLDGHDRGPAVVRVASRQEVVIADAVRALLETT